MTQFKLKYLCFTSFISSPNEVKDWLLIILSILLGIWLSLKSYQKLVDRMKTRKDSVKILFNGFKQKMWMTMGLGITFFGLYAVIVFLSSRILDKQMEIDFFFFLYKDLIFSIYIGLFIFASISLLIYLVRMIIKFLYFMHNQK